MDLGVNEEIGANMMPGEGEVVGQRFDVMRCEDWWEAMVSLGGLHDSVVREITFRSDEYVDHDHKMKLTAAMGATIRLLVQLQARDISAALFTFDGVDQSTFGHDAEEDPATCVACASGSMMFALGAWLIKARACTIQIVGRSGLGEDAQLDLWRE